MTSQATPGKKAPIQVSPEELKALRQVTDQLEAQAALAAAGHHHHDDDASAQLAETAKQ